MAAVVLLEHSSVVAVEVGMYILRRRTDQYLSDMARVSIVGLNHKLSCSTNRTYTVD